MRHTLSLALSVTATLAALLACKAPPKNDAPTAAAEPATTAPPAPPKPRPQNLVRQASTLSEALSVAGPELSDETNGTSDGAVLLLTWAANGTPDGRLGRGALERLPKTSFAKMLKDSASERGKTICAAGRIVQIARDHSASWGATPVWVGLMVEQNRDITRFYAVGSSGELVEGSIAAFCGVSVGRYDYENSAGGTSHAIASVGIFLL